MVLVDFDNQVRLQVQQMLRKLRRVVAGGSHCFRMKLKKNLVSNGRLECRGHASEGQGLAAFHVDFDHEMVGLLYTWFSDNRPSRLMQRTL